MLSADKPIFAIAAIVFLDDEWLQNVVSKLLIQLQACRALIGISLTAKKSLIVR